MKHIFTQTAEYYIKDTICSDFLKELPEAICKHTDWDYVCEKTGDGYFLKPTFRNMPYRNSFIPEININIFYIDAQNVLHMRGKPVKSVRIFMAFWFSFLLIMEIFILATADFSNLADYSLFIPVIMCTFGYLLCEIATKITFKSVVKAIKKEFS